MIVAAMVDTYVLPFGQRLGTPDPARGAGPGAPAGGLTVGEVASA